MFQIKATCNAGHEQTAHFDESFTKEFVQTQAGLLDGTSPLYAFPPDVHSMIGKCGICGERIKAEVIKVINPGPLEEGDISVNAVPGGVQMRQSN